MTRQPLQPENYVDRISQRLIESALAGDENDAEETLAYEHVDVNYMGTVSLRVKYTDSTQREGVADEVLFDYQEFKQDVTPLFAAAHSGHVGITKKLLAARADVNQKLFKGYATTVAAREGHHRVLDLLLRAGAGQPAVEDALLEACLFGNVKAAELMISSEMTRPDVLAQALVHASNRGFVEVVATLIKSGVDVDSWHRILLRSAKPSLYANVNCTPLIAAIVGRQTRVVEYLLKAGAKTGCKASLGAWSWDSGSGEELRVGAGLGEPYNEAWCAVEYWEKTGLLLSNLLKYLSPNSVHNGRTLICHAILCRNMTAMQQLLRAGADAEYLMQARDGQERPLHYAARSGWLPALKLLIAHGCALNATTESKDSALMICARAKFWDCFEELLMAGADFGLFNRNGENAVSIATANGNASVVYDKLWNALVKGRPIHSSDPQVFSTLHFVAKLGDVKVLLKVLQQTNVNVNSQDKYGYTAAMIAAQEGHVEAFKVLVNAGADICLKNRNGETAISLAKNGIRESLEWIILDGIMTNVIKGEHFHPLHFAARRGHLEVLGHLLKRDCAINSRDEDGHTALMLTAREGHAEACKLLLLAGADTSITNACGESALALARKNSSSKAVEGAILDHMARKLVLMGCEVSKHTRQGRGSPHPKALCMLKSGLLSWGQAKRRNVVCTDAVIGPSAAFQRNRRRNGDANKPGVFRIVTSKGKEFHFVALAAANAELWVRGINLITKEVMASSGTIDEVRLR